jgi:ribosome-associated protein
VAASPRHGRPHEEAKLTPHLSSATTTSGLPSRETPGPDQAHALDSAAHSPSVTLERVTAALDDMKAEDVITIDLAGKTSLADAMIIASGRSNRHVGSIAERVVEFLKAAGQPVPRIEGFPHCDWVLVDAGDVIVHVFRPEVRQFYNLEKMWGADRPVEPGQDAAPDAPSGAR